MAFPTYTNTFTNGSTADATQVNQNFTDILNGISDTTKDISVNAITCVGTATLNGNVTLGTSSAKSLTVNASLSSSIAVASTNLYEIGAASFGLKSIYLGCSTGTIRIVPAATSNWTLTLPTTAGLVNQFPITDGSGTLTWTYGPVGPAINPQSATYAILTTDDAIYVTSGASNRTLTLPTAVGVSGKKYTIVKVDSGAGTVIIATTSAQTVGGSASAVHLLATINDSIRVQSDGANWQIISFNVEVAMRYTTITSTSIPTSFAVMPFNVLVKDTHSWYNTTTGLYTIQIPGVYSVKAVIFTAALTLTTAQGFQLAVFKNGGGSPYGYLAQTFGAGGGGQAYGISGSDDIPCVAGDTLGIYAQAGAVGGLSTNAGFNHLSIVRLGD